MNEAWSADKVNTNNAEDTVQTDVLIIGAGLAGLTVAYRLYQKGYDIDVFEARQRVGGRVHSVFLRNQEDTYSIGELGGQNITDGGDASHMLSLIKELRDHGRNPIV